MASRDDGSAGEKLSRRLFELYYSSVVHFFRRQGFSKDDAFDLAQETFSRVFLHIDNLRSEVAARAWVLRIATNVWKNEVRRIKTAKRDAEVLSIDAPREHEDGTVEAAMEIEDKQAQNPLDDLVSKEGRRMVQEELANLPPRMRRCLFLHTFQGLKYKEVAAVMQLSIETVKSHVFQARQKLRERLERRLAREHP